MESWSIGGPASEYLVAPLLGCDVRGSDGSVAVEKRESSWRVLQGDGAMRQEAWRAIQVLSSGVFALKLEVKVGLSKMLSGIKSVSPN